MVIAWDSAMKRLLLGVAAILLLPIAMVHGADTGSVPRLNKVMIIILENANYRDALAQPFLGNLTSLPDYSLYIPDQRNDGHDTGPAFADRWMAQAFGPLLKNDAFMK